MTDSTRLPEKSYEEKIQESKPEGKVVKFHKEFTLVSKLSKSAQTSFELNLLSIAKTIGISNIDADQSRSVRVFIDKYFGLQITTEEVKYAFELYVLGEIAIAKEKGHYGTFHIEFVTAVIQAYLQYRYEPLKASNHKALPAETETRMSHEDFCKNMDRIIREHIKAINEIPKNASYDAAFEHLDSIGEIKETKEQRQIFKEAMRSRVDSPGYSESATMSIFYNGKENPEDRLRRICREEMAKKYYTLLLINQVNSESDEIKA